MTRLYAADNHVNWAVVAGALCAWDILAHMTGRRSASAWLRSHPAATTLFLLALTNHLTRADLRKEAPHAQAVRSR